MKAELEVATKTEAAISFQNLNECHKIERKRVDVDSYINAWGASI